MRFRGPKKWGANSARLEQTYSETCSKDHPHQQVMGSNSYGTRSIQKAVWPEDMCAKILRAIARELGDRVSMSACPAAVAAEEAEETGPLDADDGAIPTIVTSLGEAAEKEQEMLDGLQFDGFSRN